MRTRLSPSWTDKIYLSRKTATTGTANIDLQSNKGDVINISKILNNKYDVEVNLHLERNDWATRGNRMELGKTRCRAKRRQMYFTSRIVDVWNSLPNNVIESASVLSFAKRLDHFWNNQSIKYEPNERLMTTPGHHISFNTNEIEDLDTEAWKSASNTIVRL